MTALDALEDEPPDRPANFADSVVSILSGANGAASEVAHLLEFAEFCWKLPPEGAMLPVKELPDGMPARTSAMVGEAIDNELQPARFEEATAAFLEFWYPDEGNAVETCRLSAFLYSAGNVTIEPPAWLMVWRSSPTPFARIVH